jgi:hypothetical protein
LASQDDAFFTGHRKDLWRRRFISREAAIRVFEATAGQGLGIASNMELDREALYLTLADLLAEIDQRLSNQRRTTPTQAKRVMDQWKRLSRSLAALQGNRDAPPEPPQHWTDDIETWIKNSVEPFFGTGRPPNAFNTLYLPSFLALYSLAFDRRPSAAGGPTHRFVQGAIAEARHALKCRGNQNRHWPVTGDDALRSAIRKLSRMTSPTGADREVRALLDRMKSKLLAIRGGEKPPG